MAPQLSLPPLAARLANLEGADLRGADLSGANLVGARMIGADLEHSPEKTLNAIHGLLARL